MSEPILNSAKKETSHNYSALAIVVIFANFGSLLFGYEIGATIWLLFCFQEYSSTDDDNAAYTYYRYAYNNSFLLGFIAASTALGAVVCYGLLLQLGDNMSKKDEILLASSLYFVAALLISISSELTWNTVLPLVMLIIGKLIYGGGIASTLHSIPQYITEILPADIRGQYGSSVEFMVMFGLNLGYWVGYANDYWGGGLNWIVSFRVAYLISLGMAIASLFIPHNPIWMLYHDFPDTEVLQALQFITPTADEDDLQRMKNAVLEERKLKIIIDERLDKYQRENPGLWLLRSGVYDLLTPSLKLIAHDRLYRRCLVVKFTFNIFKILTGQSVFLYFALTLFTDIGVSNPTWFVFAYLAARLLIAYLMVFIAEKLGRRDFLLLSAGVMAGTLYLAAIVKDISMYATVAMVFISGLAFQLGFGSMAYFVLNEVTPFYIRSTANAVANMMLFTAYFCVTFLFPTMLNQMGLIGVFLFFAISNTIALYYVYYYLPETRGIELEKCYRLVDEMCDQAPDLSLLCKPCLCQCSSCFTAGKETPFDDHINEDEVRALVPERERSRTSKDWADF